jgi:glutathione S-transferase
LSTGLTTERPEPKRLQTKASSAPDYLRLNPQDLVPALETDHGIVLTLSPAICEWLDETHPRRRC